MADPLSKKSKLAYDVTLVEQHHFRTVGNEPPESTHIVSGRLNVRIAHLKQGQPISRRCYNKRVDQFLLTGEMLLDGTQAFVPGEHAQMKPGKFFEAIAQKDSTVLVIERENCNVLYPPKDKYPFQQVLDGITVFVAKCYRFSKEKWQITWRPAAVLLILAILGLGLILEDQTTNSQETRVFWREIGMSLIAALIFFVLVGWAQLLYSAKLPKVFTGFDLDDFCERLIRAKGTVRVYSTYSPLFSKSVLFPVFKKNALLGLEQDHTRKIQILLHDPLSKGIEQRQSERNDIVVVEALLENLENLKHWLESDETVNELVEVRVANSLPRHQHHQIDDDVSFSFYPRNYPGTESRSIKCPSDSPLGQFAVESFKEVWQDREYTKSLADYLTPANIIECKKIIDECKKARELSSHNETPKPL